MFKRSIDEVFFESYLYPNPANEQTELWINIKSNKEAKITLNDAAGRMIYQTDTQSLFPGHHLIPIDLINISRGCYFVNIYIDGNKQQSLKLLKM